MAAAVAAAVAAVVGWLRAMDYAEAKFHYSGLGQVTQSYTKMSLNSLWTSVTKMAEQVRL